MDEKLKSVFDNLTDEQKELAKNCKTPEEFLKSATDEMIELSEEQIEMVSGGDLRGNIWKDFCYYWNRPM